jgi:hypothetical protein
MSAESARIEAVPLFIPRLPADKQCVGRTSFKMSEEAGAGYEC